jgi:hypothetical protein
MLQATSARLQAIIGSDYPTRDASLEEEEDYKAIGMLLSAMPGAL